MRVPFQNVGAVGVIKDMPPEQLPPDAWTEAKNIRFRENAAWRFYGYRLFSNSPGWQPIFVMPVITGASFADNWWWIYAGVDRVFAMVNGLHYDITRQVGEVNQLYGQGNPLLVRWSGTVMGGVSILNNSWDQPQAWVNPAPGIRLANLAGWPADIRPQVIRAYRNYLVALRLRKGVLSDNSGGTLYPTLIRWSHPADPGQVPPSWDIADPTKDAGEYDLQGERGDEIIDALPLGDTLIVYKAESVHAMSFVGGVSVFAFRQLFGNFGMLALRCGADLGRRHFVVTDNDIVIHDGQNFNSVLDRRLRRYLFSDIDQTYYRNSFVLNYKDAREVWFCYPTSGTGPFCTKALVWNSSENSCGFRDLPSVMEGDSGQLGASGLDSWDNLPGSWEELTSAWDDYFAVAIERGVVLPHVAAFALMAVDRGADNAGQDLLALLERRALRFNAGDQSSVLNSTQTVKQILSVYPAIDGTSGAKVLVSVGAQDTPKGPVRWGLPRSFIVGVSNKVDLIGTIEASKFPSLRFSSQGKESWKLTGFEVEVNVVGGF